MLSATPAAMPWAWRLRRANGIEDERFFVGFLHSKTQRPFALAWSCDGVARTVEEARQYVSQYGVSSASFTDALNRSREMLTVRTQTPYDPREGEGFSGA